MRIRYFNKLFLQARQRVEHFFDLLLIFLWQLLQDLLDLLEVLFCAFFVALLAACDGAVEVGVGVEEVALLFRGGGRCAFGGCWWRRLRIACGRQGRRGELRRGDVEALDEARVEGFGDRVVFLEDFGAAVVKEEVIVDVGPDGAQRGRRRPGHSRCRASVRDRGARLLSPDARTPPAAAGTTGRPLRSCAALP